MPLVISTIAENELIQDIFRFRYWDVDEAIGYLVGIYKFYGPEGAEVLLTLDGREFRRPDHSNEIDVLLDRDERLRDLWEHEGRTRTKYFPRTFIRWGFKHRAVAGLSWLDDAHAKKLVTEEMFQATPSRVHTLNLREKESLLKMIAGLLSAHYSGKLYEHGIQKRLFALLEKEGVGLAENTISKHFKDALEELPRKPQ